jgi:hypothetical protein
MSSILTTAKYAHTTPFFNIATNYIATLLLPGLSLAPENLSDVPPVALGDVTLINTPDTDITTLGFAALSLRGGTQLYGDHTFYFTKISGCLELTTSPPGVASSGDMTPDKFAEAIEEIFNLEMYGNKTIT